VQILVVEDNEFVANALAAVLRPIARKIELAHSLDEARQKILRNGFTTVTLDLDLPDSVPEKTMEAIPELKRHRSVNCVIVISGSISEEEIAKAKQHGADGFLLKTDPKLIDKLRRMAAAVQNPLSTLDL
jgi:CheY-like chemotaxis protein